MTTTHTKVAVIAGAGGYLGSAISKAFEAGGWKVVGLTHKVDITNADQIQKAFAKISSEHSAIDACIHVAAPPLVRKPLLALTDEEFASQIDVATRGAFILFREAIKCMRPNGALVGITTVAIEPGRSVDAAGSYVPAKLALRGILRVLAAQLAPNIRVYAIAPGFLSGGLNSDMPEKVRELIVSKLPERTTPEEVGALALQLADGTSKISTGSSILMPGNRVTPL